MTFKAPTSYTLVLLPGMHGTGELLQPLQTQLGREFAVKVCSYPLDQTLNYASLVDYVRPKLPDGPLVILGESFSGPLAIEIAASMPDRISGLILVSTFAKHPLPSQLAPMASALSRLRLPRAVTEFLMLGADGSKALRQSLAQAISRLPPHILATRIDAALTVDKRQRLEQLKCPLLILHGTRDRLISMRCAKEIQDHAPACDLRTINGPHMILETQSELCATIISDFIATKVAGEDAVKK